MQPIEGLGALFVLAATVGIGITVHELTHAVGLRILGVPYEIRWFSAQETSTRSATNLLGAWASVTPQKVPDDVSTLGIRLSAMTPLVLTLPFALIVTGLVPDPLASGNSFFAAVTIAWLGCALPSPQDFSVFWHADRAIQADPSLES